MKILKTEEMQLNPAQKNLMNYLNAINTMKRTRALPNGLLYSSGEDFVLQHGVWYKPRRLPKDVKLGAPRACYGNSILLACVRPGWKYIEGYALADLGIGEAGLFPVSHAWNLDDNGRLVDSTWTKSGLAYRGVEFSPERADDATWEGNSCVLEDWMRRFPLFRKPWTGEDNSIPASKRIVAMRGKKFKELYALLAEEEEDSPATMESAEESL